MNKWQADMVKFHEKFGLESIHVPQLPTIATRLLRISLIEEEVRETVDGIHRDNLVDIADGIVDSIYVLIGTAVSYGIDLNPLWKEVHRTNMLKDNGPVRGDGKVLKPEGWQPPRIKELLIKQGADADQFKPIAEDGDEKPETA